MHIPELNDSSVCNRLCPACGKRLERRPNEPDVKYAVRTFCGRPCWMASKKQAAKRVHRVLAG